MIHISGLPIILSLLFEPYCRQDPKAFLPSMDLDDDMPPELVETGQDVGEDGEDSP